ncbi:MAG: 50S ribosomal protein L2 [Oligoflexales bacterium]|nr:50S ribosomal protein L2 [Oligoflexales bacterium]
MALKIYKPTSAGQRGRVSVDYSHLDDVAPYAPLTEGKHRKGGRNSLGRITTRHQGGGAKQKYRIVDFKRGKRGIQAVVEYLEYDPNRTAFIARVVYLDGERNYILAPDGLKKGDRIIASEEMVDVQVGNAMPLSKIPFGTNIHNIEMKMGKGGQIARSAGSACQLVGRIDGYAQLKMPSGEMRLVREECFATIGTVSNLDHANEKIGKAGRKRWRNIRPTVRGVVMNPVDHPHGGGEGKTSGGRHPVTPWAMPTKGYKTRKNKRTTKFIIKDRRVK